jgi:2-polyprenyl-3-methyl-5-hydroxy-6-metoxy-1,4-benzoquinol methylase
MNLIILVELKEINMDLSNIYCDDIEHYLSMTTETFEIITLWQVIEHLTDPVKILSLINEKLSKNGVICIAVPNRDRIIKSSWGEPDSPPHRFTRII